MIDPTCKVCFPGDCVHGIGSPTPEELLVDSLKQQIADRLHQEIVDLRARVKSCKADAEAREREACAKLADECHSGAADYRPGVCCAWWAAHSTIAEEIRARGGT